jgi:hypothetical protein
MLELVKGDICLSLDQIRGCMAEFRTHSKEFFQQSECNCRGMFQGERLKPQVPRFFSRPSVYREFTLVRKTKEPAPHRQRVSRCTGRPSRRHSTVSVTHRFL